METNSRWVLHPEEKDRLITALTPELATLRTKADISQEELAELIGVSRQTYGALERGGLVAACYQRRPGPSEARGDRHGSTGCSAPLLQGSGYHPI